MKKVLIVEDEVISALDIKINLEKSGYEIIDFVSDRPGALKTVSMENPDVVILDIRLRGNSNGLDTAEEIYTKYNIPCILMSGYDTAHIEQLLENHHKFPYLTKPIQYSKLYEMLEKICKD